MMSRTYHSSADDHAGFIIVIIVVCVYWAHKPVMQKVERIAFVVALTVTALLCSLWILRIFRKLSRWRQRQNPSLPVIDTMTGLEFEKYVAQQLRANGFSKVQLTEEYDLGIDIIAEKNGVRWGIQIKRYSGLVKANAVRQVVTALKFLYIEY